MKKIIDKKIIFGFIIGVLITSGISIGAISMYSANQVSYKKADNTEIDVKTALDELYIFDNSGDATADDIASGKTALVKGKLVTGTNVSDNSTIKYLGTGTSFDISNYSEYGLTKEQFDSLTADNFIVETVSASASKQSANYSVSLTRNDFFVSTSSSYSINKNYDNLTGLFTVASSGNSIGRWGWGGNVKNTATATWTPSFKVYLIA